MVIVDSLDLFKNKYKKIKNKDFRTKVKKQIRKIIDNPEIGKPMMHKRKGTRELYIKSYRLAYCYKKEEKLVILLDIYHKDKQ